MSRIYYDARDLNQDVERRMQYMEFLLNHGVTVMSIKHVTEDAPLGSIIVRVMGDRISVGKVVKHYNNSMLQEYEYIYIDPNPIEWTIPSEWCGTKPNPNPFDMMKHRLPLLEILQGTGPIVQGLAVDEMKRE